MATRRRTRCGTRCGSSSCNSPRWATASSLGCRRRRSHCHLDNGCIWRRLDLGHCFLELDPAPLRFHELVHAPLKLLLTLHCSCLTLHAFAALICKLFLKLLHLLAYSFELLLRYHRSMLRSMGSGALFLERSTQFINFVLLLRSRSHCPAKKLAQLAQLWIRRSRIILGVV